MRFKAFRVFLFLTHAPRNKLVRRALHHALPHLNNSPQPFEHCAITSCRTQHQIELGPTVSRSVRGSMQELAFAVEAELQRGRFSTRVELQLYLSTYIMGAIGLRSPCEVTRELLRHPRKDS